MSRFVIIWSGQMLMDFLELKARKDSLIIYLPVLAVSEKTWT